MSGTVTGIIYLNFQSSQKPSGLVISKVRYLVKGEVEIHTQVCMHLSLYLHAQPHTYNSLSLPSMYLPFLSCLALALWISLSHSVSSPILEINLLLN